MNVANPAKRLDVGISAREAEVLAAVGEHLTNAEIGARLFISIRTVESHVSSLLRKLQVTDRRALATLAVTEAAPLMRGSNAPVTVTSTLPSTLTPFIGREVEREEMAAALGEHRLVTAVGPGGVGKTRLALAVAADIAERFDDGVWYVDLVPVSDGQMIAPAVADVLGIGERANSSAADDVAQWLADRQTLLILDNCEHLLDGVVVLLERLLAGSPRTVVLATSRARLLVPFERVFAVPGLAVRSTDGRPGDAVELFLGRAAVSGTPVASTDINRIAAICRALDGMALAIELAAARYASVGVDGLEAGLGDRLRLLTGGPRVDDRHRSLRSTLDWSYALLAEPEQGVLRRVSVFSQPFTAAAARTVLADWAPVDTDDIPAVLAALTDRSLLIAMAGTGGTRYRALETIRQYGVDRLDDAGESVEALARHLGWCERQCAVLDAESEQVDGAWRAAFDRVADELRSALGWASGRLDQSARGHVLALGLAHLCFVRGLPGESQRRYEQAADLAPDRSSAAKALRYAAGAAESRHVGNDALRLRRAAAAAALEVGDRAAAAADLALVAERINRGPGLMAVLPPVGEAESLIAQGWELAGDDPSARVRLLIAEAFAGSDGDPVTLERTEQAIALARQVADPLAESAALDQLTSMQLARGEIRAAAASALHRTELLAPMRVTALSGMEFFDGFVMAAECAIAAGDLPSARHLAERLRDLPFYREEGHLACSRLLVVTTLVGDWAEASELANRFREGWERAGCPRAGNLSRGAYAAATMFGLRGDDVSRSAWLEIVHGLETPGRDIATVHYGEFFDALLWLHRGRIEQAIEVMPVPPEGFREWFSGMWRPWYAALWAEAAVLCSAPDAAHRIERARPATADNPVAAAIVERAAALHAPGGDRSGLSVAAAALERAGCRYQWARTLVMIGDEHRTRGERALADMGATPMVWPPG